MRKNPRVTTSTFILLPDASPIGSIVKAGIAAHPPFSTLCHYKPPARFLPWFIKHVMSIEIYTV